MRMRAVGVAAVLIAVGLAISVTVFVLRGHGSRPPACITDRQQLLSSSAASRAEDAAIIAHRRPPDLSHVVLIMMENRECGQVIGSPDAPYLTSLAHRYAQPRAFYGITHPSLPNYLALTSGSTFGFTDSCSGCSVRARNLVDEFEAAGISWRAYMEGLPRPCFQGRRAGLYRRRHDPFMFYDNIAHNPARCAKVVPLSQLAIDEAHHALPRFAWISPNLCHDMHNCTTRAGDTFLSGLVPPLLRAVGRRGVVIITWDEGDTRRGCCSKAAGGNIPTILAGPSVRPGLRSALPYDAYSILRTIEDSWGLPRLGGAACRCTPPLTAMFRASLTRPSLRRPG
jgi:phosphatidylinositol-3-phosphatase